MAKKRPSLNAQLGKQKEPAPMPTPKASARARNKKAQDSGKNQTSKTRPYRAPSRQGKKAISGFFEPAVAKQLKVLAAMEERSTQALLGEALNLLFEKYGKDAIAEDGKTGL